MKVAAAARVGLGVLFIGLSASASAFLPLIMGAGAAISGMGAGAAVAGGAAAAGAGMAANAGTAAAGTAVTDGAASTGIDATEVLQSGADSAASTATQHAVDSAMSGKGGVEATDKSCQADAKRYCADASGKTLDCLLDHQKDVSDACYEALKKRVGTGQSADQKAESQDANASMPGASDCSRDIHRFCADVRPGGGRVVSCLHGHQKDLSDACYDAMAKQM